MGKQKFDSEEFWEYMREISKYNKVFISEQNAPDDFQCIWEKPFTRTLDVNKNNQFQVTEKLFTYDAFENFLMFHNKEVARLKGNKNLSSIAI